MKIKSCLVIHYNLQGLGLKVYNHNYHRCQTSPTQNSFFRSSSCCIIEFFSMTPFYLLNHLAIGQVLTLMIRTMNWCPVIWTMCVALMSDIIRYNSKLPTLKNFNPIHWNSSRNHLILASSYHLLGVDGYVSF